MDSGYYGRPSGFSDLHFTNKQNTLMYPSDDPPALQSHLRQYHISLRFDTVVHIEAFEGGSLGAFPKGIISSIKNTSLSKI